MGKSRVQEGAVGNRVIGSTKTAEEIESLIEDF